MRYKFIISERLKNKKIVIVNRCMIRMQPFVTGMIICK